MVKILQFLCSELCIDVDSEKMLVIAMPVIVAESLSKTIISMLAEWR